MLSNKVCIIAGAGTGIGEAVAVRIAELGARVVVNDLGTDLAGHGESDESARRTVETIRNSGGEAVVHHGDVTSLSYAEELIADTIETFDRLDGVANFAGILSDAPLWEMSGEEWDRVINVHLRGHFSLLRASARHWRERSLDDGTPERRASFVCVSSGSGAIPVPDQSNYSAAKAGILGLSRTAAVELHDFDVRVNAIMPFARTRMADNVPVADRQWDIEELPEPAEMAPIVAYLLSDYAEDITGCTIGFEGEQMAFVSDPEKARVAYQEDTWTSEALRDRFRSVFGREELDNSIRKDW